MRCQSVKYVVNLHVRVQKRRAIAGEVQAVKNQVFKCFFQVCVSDEHCTDHPSPQQEHAHETAVGALDQSMRQMLQVTTRTKVSMALYLKVSF